MAKIAEPPIYAIFQDERGIITQPWVQWLDNLRNESNDNRSKIITKELNSSSSVAFTRGITSANQIYEIDLIDVRASSLNSGLRLRASTDTGTTYLEGSTDYQWSRNTNGVTTTEPLASRLVLTDSDLGTTSAHRVQGTIHVVSPASSEFTYLSWSLRYLNSSDSLRSVEGVGLVRTTTPLDSLKVLPSAGSLTSGTIKLYSLQ